MRSRSSIGPARRVAMRRPVTAGAALVSVLALASSALPVPAAPALATGASAVAAVTSKPGVVSAQLAAAAQGARVEVENARTESSSTFANPDGTFTTEASGPFRARTAEGWKPLDATLSTAADGDLAPAVSLDRLSVSKDGSGDLATLTHAGHSVRLDWPAALSAATVTGSAATYPLAGGASLRVNAHEDGFELGVVLSKPLKSAPSWRLPLHASGLTAAPAAGGGVVLSAADGTKVFGIDSARMWDATRDAAGDPANEHAVDIAVTGTAPNQTLAITP